MAHRKSFARLPGQRESVHKTQPDSRRPLLITRPLECLDCLPVIRHGFDPLFIRIQSVGHHAPRLDQMAIVLRLCRKRQGLARNRKALPGRAAAWLAAEGESHHDQRERHADEQNERQPGGVLMRKLESAQADVPPLCERVAQPAEDVR